MLSDSILGVLQQPLDPDRVEVRQGKIPYLAGHDVIRTANRIFGFGGWGFEVEGNPQLMEENEQGEQKTFYQVWAVTGRLTIEGGSTFRDVGVSVRQGRGSAPLEMALKGAATDAMKRCLRNYGDQFGLVLYGDTSEEDLRRWFNEANGTPQRQPEPPQEPEGPLPFEDEPDPYMAEYEGFLQGIKSNGISLKWAIMGLGGPEVATKEEAQAWWNDNAFAQLKGYLEAGEGRHWSDVIAEAQKMKEEAAA